MVCVFLISGVSQNFWKNFDLKLGLSLERNFIGTTNTQTQKVQIPPLFGAAMSISTFSIGLATYDRSIILSIVQTKKHVIWINIWCFSLIWPRTSILKSFEESWWCLMFYRDSVMKLLQLLAFRDLSVFYSQLYTESFEDFLQVFVLQNNWFPRIFSIAMIIWTLLTNHSSRLALSSVSLKPTSICNCTLISSNRESLAFHSYNC